MNNGLLQAILNLLMPGLGGAATGSVLGNALGGNNNPLASLGGAAGASSPSGGAVSNMIAQDYTRPAMGGAAGQDSAKAAPLPSMPTSDLQAMDLTSSPGPSGPVGGGSPNLRALIAQMQQQSAQPYGQRQLPQIGGGFA